MHLIAGVHSVFNMARLLISFTKMKPDFLKDSPSTLVLIIEAKQDHQPIQSLMKNVINRLEGGEIMTSEPRTTFRPSALRLARMDRLPEPPPLTLARAVQSAVRRVDETKLLSSAEATPGLFFQPKALLALLAYCYARQIYGSREIERVLAHDAVLCQVCQDDFPKALIIWQFCRDNRDAVRTCLIAALSFLADQNVVKGLVTRVSSAHIMEEANRRIIMAMFTDSMEPAGN